MKKLWLILALAACLLLAGCGSVKPADAGLTEETVDTGEAEAEAGEAATEEAAAEEEAAEEEATEEVAAEEEAAGGVEVASGLNAGGLVFMVPATDEVLEPYDDFDVFNYNPGVQPLLFYTERDIPNFRLVSVTVENDGGSLTFAPDQLLYQRNWLNPERPSLIQILPQGDVNSGFGVTFTDPEEPETEHFYVLTPTGRGDPGDPPLVFTEIY
ncbi:MAG: hypothetical protein IKG74_04790 [Firmicutes bacterium]|nr:hypothetical protein [Bacillota bacterium]